MKAISVSFLYAIDRVSSTRTKCLLQTCNEMCGKILHENFMLDCQTTAFRLGVSLIKARKIMLSNTLVKRVESDSVESIKMRSIIHESRCVPFHAMMLPIIDPRRKRRQSVSNDATI